MGIGTTPARIRDRMALVISQLVPVFAKDDAFILFEAKEKANKEDFVRWCQENRAAALRQVFVRVAGGRNLPTGTSVDIEELETSIEIAIAYPQDSRAGDDQAYSRDEMIEADRKQVNRATGLVGRANFTAPFPEACCIGSDLPDTRSGDGIDFLEITHRLVYVAEY
jgi:hypothetical protein